MKKIFVFFIVLLMSICTIVPSFALNGAPNRADSTSYTNVLGDIVLSDTNEFSLNLDTDLSACSYSVFYVTTGLNRFLESDLVFSGSLPSFSFDYTFKFSSKERSLFSKVGSYTIVFYKPGFNLIDLVYNGSYTAILSVYYFYYCHDFSHYTLTLIPMSEFVSKSSYTKFSVYSEVYSMVSSEGGVAKFNFPEGYDAYLFDFYSGVVGNNTLYYYLALNVGIGLRSSFDYTKNGGTFSPYIFSPAFYFSIPSDSSIIFSKVYGLKFTKNKTDQIIDNLNDPNSELHKNLTSDFVAALNDPSFGNVTEEKTVADAAIGGASDLIENFDQAESEIFDSAFDSLTLNKPDITVPFADRTLLRGLSFWNSCLTHFFNVNLLHLLLEIAISIGLVALVLGVVGRSISHSKDRGDK